MARLVYYSIFGAVVGEMMLTAEQDIIAGGGEVMGSETMGDVSLFFLNPVGHIHYWVSDAWGGSAEFQFSSSPWFGNQDGREIRDGLWRKLRQCLLRF